MTSRWFCAAVVVVSYLTLIPEAQSEPSRDGNRPNPRQQTTNITAFLDGSVIYGSDPVRAKALRTFSGGMLKTSGGNLPPFNTAGLPNANDAHILPDNQLILAGDVRANENVELSSVHALWIREHNLIAGKIAADFPGLNDEKIFQWTRQIVGAELQVITYKEFLPALLGTHAVRPYSGYKAGVNAGIASEFSTAAYRIGHTLINDDVEFLDNNGNAVRPEIELRDAFFDPTSMEQAGIDPILKYLATDNTQEVDLKLVDGLRNFLFGAPGQGGFDLASLNIQRGRDHGLADYNSTRKAFGLRPVRSFSQITSDPNLQIQLQSLYGSVDNIDLWVGGLAEDHAANASVGPTFLRIIAEQFERTRDGDSFWYQRVFSGIALAALESTRLADVIRRNTAITNLQDNVFFFNAGVAATNAGHPERQGKLTLDTLIRSAGVTLKRMREFRSIDGRGNNRAHPEWGQAGGELLRLAPAAYADGLSEPAGAGRPSARVLSNSVCAETEAESDQRNVRFMADWVYAWGQFIDHDLDLTSTGSTPFDVAVPKNDPFFDPGGSGTQTIPLDRSNFDPATGIRKNAPPALRRRSRR